MLLVNANETNKKINLQKQKQILLNFVLCSIKMQIGANKKYVKFIICFLLRLKIV